MLCYYILLKLSPAPVRKSLLALCVLSAIATSPAFAGDPVTDRRIEALEAQVKALQAELQALKSQPVAATPAPAATPASSEEAEIDALAATPEAAPATADSTESVAATPGTTSASGANGNAFNPAISIILNGSYSHHSLDPDNYVRAGFPLAGESGPSPNGFSLGESEVSFAANIDDKFYGQLTASIESEDGDDHLGIEEAYIDTTALPAGFSLRLGRFFSNIGYLNGHHAHTDNFFDRPLAYQAFLGGQYGDDGVQLRWVAPTSLLFEVGGEVLRGQNYPSGGAQDGGLGTRTLFAHMGGDVGSNNEWLAGVSMLKTKTADGEDGFNGDAKVYLADATWKWAPQGNFKDGGITLRTEYFRDDRDGVFIDPQDDTLISPWDGQRSGAYVEAVYRLNRLWDIGYRYDKLWADSNGPFASDFDPDRHTAELTWRNSEFSLFRLQLSHDKPNTDDSDNAVTVQYQTSLGAHGAHKF
ncbi:TonB-dependent receptor [Lysobacter rhizosphaerae]